MFKIRKSLTKSSPPLNLLLKCHPERSEGYIFFGLRPQNDRNKDCRVASLLAMTMVGFWTSQNDMRIGSCFYFTR